MINWDKGKAVTFLLESLGEYFFWYFISLALIKVLR